MRKEIIRLLYRVLSIIVLCVLASFTYLPTAYASGEFQADYDVQYAITPVGKTIVTQHVTLTNKLSNYYPKQYSLLLDSDKISNVIAYDDGGVITPAISVKDGKTTIALAFNTQTIGIGKSFVFSLRYEHSGVASQNGSIWEVYIPGITNDPDIGDYTVTVAVPPTFGPSAYLSPRPVRGNTWNKDQMIRGGIAGAYGSYQNFALTLRYTLTNGSMGKQIQEIALPPDTAYQKITLESLSPSPQTVTSDANGNWIARYELLPTQVIPVSAKVRAAIYLTPRKDYTPPTADPALFLSPRDYWEVTDPKIQELAKRYVTPRQIYDYVSSSLTYDYTRVSSGANRLGAVATLGSPKTAVCTEFTDLFIAIARAAGIPSRRNVGYAYTNNPKLRPLSLVTDVLHAWPEYYDAAQKIWVPVDPTWANTTGGADYFTKLDFNHIVFAINGTDSSLPYPAGFYHSPTKQAKDVDVVFAQTASRALPADITSSIEFPSQVGAGTNPAGAIIVTNKGGESAYTISVTAVSDVGVIRVSEIIPELLPYAVMRIPLRSSMPQGFQTQRGTITARVNDAGLTYTFTVRPLYWLIGAMILFILAAIIIAMKLARIFVWKTFHKH